jgi:excisionase family DNA binding protein
MNTLAFQTPPMHGPQLLNVNAGAKCLGISTRKLWALAAPRGEIPIVRIGRSVRFRPEDLAAFVKNNIVEKAV